MLKALKNQPKRVLMTLDAVGGVWRYCMDLARALRSEGVETVFVGSGPHPSDKQHQEAERLGALVWLDIPLDWMAQGEEELDGLPEALLQVAATHAADLLHLNLPSQAYDLRSGLPVIVVSHSCVVSWWEAVRGTPLLAQWEWQKRRNRIGFDRADAVLSPSASHADLLERCYGPIDNLEVVHNAVATIGGSGEKENFVFAAGRWWDEGKNGAVLDQAAARAAWPVMMAGPTSGPNGQSVGLSHARQLGELPNGEVRALMNRAGIVVSPSVYEPFGLAALEAARSGAALVLADIPTYRELWDGAALFAAPHSPDAFSQAINRLAGDPHLRSEMGRQALVRSERFSLSAQASAVLEVYRSAMAEKAQLPAASE